MDLIAREVPFGAPARGGKRTLYTIADPFLRTWFRFVEPERSRLEARRIEAVTRHSLGLSSDYLIQSDTLVSEVPLAR